MSTDDRGKQYRDAIVAARDKLVAMQGLSGARLLEEAGNLSNEMELVLEGAEGLPSLEHELQDHKRQLASLERHVKILEEENEDLRHRVDSTSGMVQFENDFGHWRFLAISGPDECDNRFCETDDPDNYLVVEHRPSGRDHSLTWSARLCSECLLQIWGDR